MLIKNLCKIQNVILDYKFDYITGDSLMNNTNQCFGNIFKVIYTAHMSIKMSANYGTIIWAVVYRTLKGKNMKYNNNFRILIDKDLNRPLHHNWCTLLLRTS